MNILVTHMFRFKNLLRGPRGASSKTNMMLSDLQTPIMRTMWQWSNDAITRASFISSDYKRQWKPKVSLLKSFAINTQNSVCPV